MVVDSDDSSVLDQGYNSLDRVACQRRHAAMDNVLDSLPRVYRSPVNWL